MPCQRCGKARLVRIHGKTSDMFDMSFNGESKGGYVPSHLFFGEGQYGDYMEVTFCADCGQIQAQFPISDKKLNEAMDGLDSHD